MSRYAEAIALLEQIAARPTLTMSLLYEIDRVLAIPENEAERLAHEIDALELVVSLPNDTREGP